MKLQSQISELRGSISIPASKSHTIRAVAVATMAEGTSILREPLISDDALSAIETAKKFGAEVTSDGNDLIIKGLAGKIRPTTDFIDVGNSGTTLRIFAALAALHNSKITFDGDKSIRTRMMSPLLNALANLGVSVESLAGKCPCSVKGTLKGGVTEVEGISSQFLTALLFATPLAECDSEITVNNLHEKPYVEITLDWLRSQNIIFEHKGLDWYKIKGGQQYKAFDRRIPADFSSATFAVAAAAITGNELLITGLDFSDHQGDKAVFDFFKRMGGMVNHTADGVIVKGGKLKGIEIDMNDTPDALPAMAVVACFAEGQTKLINVAQARLKECDRISAIATELKKMGADIEELPDGLIINKSKLKGVEVHGYDDHRMVMALALAGMGAEGITTIDTAEAISVTYPSFVSDFSKLGAKFELIK